MHRASADATVFHAIADPTRRAILELLRDREMTVSAMLEAVRRDLVRMSQSAFSQHLGVLRRAGLVVGRRDGRRRFYRVEPAPLHEVNEWISFFDRFWDEKLDGLGRYLDRAGPTEAEGASG